MPLEQAKVYQNVVMKLSVLRFMVKTKSRAGLTDLNRHCESFFAQVLNRVYGYQLVNLNQRMLNAPAIDLADNSRRLCFQVTVTSRRQKVEETIETFLREGLYDRYDELRFFMLSEKKAYKHAFDTQGKFEFDPKDHIVDLDDVLEEVGTLDFSKLKSLSDYIDEQLGSVTRALAPQSLLASAEPNEGVPPRKADRLRTMMLENEPGAAWWPKDFKSLMKLYEKLLTLSFSQREIVFFIFHHGQELNRRLAISILTLEEKLRLERTKMKEYFDVLKHARIVCLDDEDDEKFFELSWRLAGSEQDAFVMLGALDLSEDEGKRLIVDCDFSVLEQADSIR